MHNTDWNFSQAGEAERPALPDYLLPEEDERFAGKDRSADEEEPAPEHELPARRDGFEDVGSHLVRHTSRSRPNTSLAFRGKMSEAMSAALFEQIAVERSEIAFREFYDFLAPKAYSIIYRIVQVEDDALDLLQEVFTHFWNSAPELYKRHSNISAWILLLARNRAIDEIRSTRFLKQRQTESYDVLEHEYLVTDTHTTDETLTADSGRLEIQKAFEILSVDHRKIMELVYFAGMSMKSVAETLQIPSGTVRKAVHSSIKKLRGTLGAETSIPLQMDRPPKKTETKSRAIKQPEPVEVKPIETTKPVESVKILAETTKAPAIKKVPKAKKPPKEKIPKEKAVKPEVDAKISKRAEGKSRRAMKLHFILDDLMKNRQDVLDTPALINESENSTSLRTE